MRRRHRLSHTIKLIQITFLLGFLAVLIGVNIAYQKNSSSHISSQVSASPAGLIYGIGPSLGRWYNPAKDTNWEASMIQAIVGACGNVLRTGLDWGQIEPNPPQINIHTYQWENFDRLINLASQNSIQIVGLLITSPGWANGGHVADSHQYPPTDANQADYAAFLTALVNRYANKITRYEFWNEANNCGWRPGCGTDKGVKATEYIKWLKITYDTIKSLNPTVQVSTTGLDRADTDFLQRLYTLTASGTNCNGKPCWDAVAVHPYSGGGAFDFAGIEAVRQLMLANNDDKPIWITEYGWSTSDGTKANNIQQTLTTLAQPAYSYVTIANYLVIADTPQTTDWGIIKDDLSTSTQTYSMFKSIACNGLSPTPTSNPTPTQPSGPTPTPTRSPGGLKPGSLQIKIHADNVSNSTLYSGGKAIPNPYSSSESLLIYITGPTSKGGSFGEQLYVPGINKNSCNSKTGFPYQCTTGSIIWRGSDGVSGTTPGPYTARLLQIPPGWDKITGSETASGTLPSGGGLVLDLAIRQVNQTTGTPTPSPTVDPNATITPTPEPTLPDATPTEKSTVYGDTNADGVVDTIDYLYYIRAVTGGALPNGVDPDVNSDGDVSLIDREIIVNILRRQRVNPPGWGN